MQFTLVNQNYILLALFKKNRTSRILLNRKIGHTLHAVSLNENNDVVSQVSFLANHRLYIPICDQMRFIECLTIILGTQRRSFP